MTWRIHPLGHIDWAQQARRLPHRLLAQSIEDLREIVHALKTPE
jgi:hypothetical protein